MIYSIKEFEKFDKVKSKVLKYVLYKKRTEQEVRQKFSKEFEENILEDVIEGLKESKYIDDSNYIERTISEFISLKSLSIKEIKYKLYSKGLRGGLIDDYVSKHEDELIEYEKKSAYKIAHKKKSNMDDDEIKVYMMKKGYSDESIRYALTGEDN